MQSRRRMRGQRPPFVDPAFAEGLSSSRRDRSSFHSKPDHKTQQLCRQAERVLTLAFADLHDDVLRDLQVDAVAPFPDASRLVVRLALPAGASLADVMQRLERVQGHLRHTLTQSITRKRAPDLVFVPMAAGEVQP